VIRKYVKKTIRSNFKNKIVLNDKSQYLSLEQSTKLKEIVTIIEFF